MYIFCFVLIFGIVRWFALVTICGEFVCFPYTCSSKILSLMYGGLCLICPWALYLLHAAFTFLSLCVGWLILPKKSLGASEMLNALSGVQEESTTSEAGAKRKTSSKLTRLFKIALGKATTLN
jgi:hypothetical protein